MALKKQLQLNALSSALKEVRGKTVLLRVDFNVPMKGHRVLDTTRIKRALPTIRLLLKNDCRIVIISHLGRPKGRRVQSLSLKPVYGRLRKELKGVTSVFINEKVSKGLAVSLKKRRARIMMLENLRFDAREKENSATFAIELAALGDVYVNDAFSVSHRSVTSIVGVPKLLPCYAGVNFMEEVAQLSKLQKPVKPALAIIGGVKLDSKYGVIKKLLDTYTTIVVGGGVANVFLKARGYAIGDSVCQDQYVRKAKYVTSSKILLPIDFIVADTKTKKKVHYEKLAWGLSIAEPGEMILDIGSETRALIEEQIKRSKTIMWGGPVGYSDDPLFAEGSLAVARTIVARSKEGGVHTVVGGGDTITLLQTVPAVSQISFISTAGGAMLEFLEGKQLPGIKALLK